MPNISKTPCLFLLEYLNKKFNNKIFMNILKNVSVHKLSKKIPFGNDSFGNYIINYYGKRK